MDRKRATMMKVWAHLHGRDALPRSRVGAVHAPASGGCRGFDLFTVVDEAMSHSEVMRLLAALVTLDGMTPLNAGMVTRVTRDSRC